MATGRWRHKMAVHGGKLYVLGGFDGIQRLASSLDPVKATEDVQLPPVDRHLVSPSAGGHGLSPDPAVQGSVVFPDLMGRLFPAWDTVRDAARRVKSTHRISSERVSLYRQPAQHKSAWPSPSRTPMRNAYQHVELQSGPKAQSHRQRTLRQATIEET
ncbi:hypothetical protein CRUP_007464, partial [Coryphaenoides rupestris]